MNEHPRFADLTKGSTLDEAAEQIARRFKGEATFVTLWLNCGHEQQAYEGALGAEVGRWTPCTACGGSLRMVERVA